jgi:hypothetical protein
VSPFERGFHLGVWAGIFAATMGFVAGWLGTVHFSDSGSRRCEHESAALGRRSSIMPPSF